MKRFITPSLIALGATLLALLTHVPVQSVEEHITRLKYNLRGPLPADTNIVIIYLDNEAIRELGYPLRRNFYALMVNALDDLQAKAVGIDIVFESTNPEYPEYDQLFAHTLSHAGNVVLASYFDSLRPEPLGASKEIELLDAFHFPHVMNPPLHGGELHLPVAPFVLASSGVGHTNVVAGTSMPLVVLYGRGIVPSFGLELLRRFCNIERENVVFDRNELHVAGSHIHTGDDGAASLNFVGPIRSFTTYPFLAVLKSYDVLRAGGSPAVPVQNFRGKIFLIGIIAEGRTQTFATPFDDLFPPIGLHATFLDNAISSRFVIHIPEWLVYLLSAFLAFACATAGTLLHASLRWTIALGVILGSAAVSLVLFMTASVILPVLPPAIAGLAASMAAFSLRHRLMREQLTTVQSEKDQVAQQLRDKEARVATLERELVGMQATSERTSELMEEIRRYKAEIHVLTSKADDMEEVSMANSLAQTETGDFEGLVYAADGPMHSVVDFISKIAHSSATVLILGESGTGKELAARAIHRRSGRSQQPFVAVNCGALAENLLESELFGHEKGAFTGAVKEKPGRFELADGGTILLDEIGEVSESFQLKLLRVLQEGEFERVGGTRTTKVNVRVIAATNKDLKQLVKERNFREDLYYRLNVLSVELPPLRDRPDDIPLLINHFLLRDERGMKLSRNVLETLQNHAWHGNIRELESVITRAVLLARADKRDMIVMKDLSEEITSATKGSIAFEDQILESLREKGFSRSAISDTADELGGLNRGTIAEHFRGLCLKAFVDHTYNIDEAARYISLSADTSVHERVRKKLHEYLTNIDDAVDPSKSWDAIRTSLKPKTKNLPQKYHIIVEQVAEARFRNVWKA